MSQEPARPRYRKLERDTRAQLYCGQCGKHVSLTDKSCASCGAELPADQPRYIRHDAPVAPPAATFAMLPLTAVIAAALVVVGSLGPWAKALGFLTISGTDGDGVLTLVFGIGAGVAMTPLIIRPRQRVWLTVAAVLCFLGAASIGLYDWVNITRTVSEPQVRGLVSVSWGLPLLTVSAGAGLIVSGIHFMNEIR